MRNRLMPTDQIVVLLTDGPGKIRIAAGDKTDEELAETTATDEWSPNEILAHLRACQDIWGDSRIARMLSEGHPIMRAVNPNTWLAQTSYREMPFRRSLAEFAEQRASFMRTVRGLPPDQWTRTGTFTGGGRRPEYSVHSEADALARHERSHIRQIERLRRATSKR